MIVSSAAYLTGGLPYLSRGVLGDLAGLTLLAAVGLTVDARVRHEALVCLGFIGSVLLLDPDWPMDVRARLVGPLSPPAVLPGPATDEAHLADTALREHERDPRPDGRRCFVPHADAGRTPALSAASV